MNDDLMSRYIDADKEGAEKVKEKMIELTNGAFLIIKANTLMDYEQYKNMIEGIEQAIHDGSMIVPPGVDVIVIDKEGKAVKA